VVRKGKRNNADDLPLDDRRWVALKKAHNIISEQLTGEQLSPLASFDLIEGLQSEKLRCMRRSLINPSERKRLSASFWRGLRIDVEVDCIRFLPSVPIKALRDFREIHLWVYYVWEPDIEKLWPSTAADQKLTEMSPRPRPGKTPKYGWPLVVAAEVIRRLGSGGKHPTAPAMIRHCKETIGYEPDDSDMRKLLKFLRGHKISISPDLP